MFWVLSDRVLPEFRTRRSGEIQPSVPCTIPQTILGQHVSNPGYYRPRSISGRLGCLDQSFLNCPQTTEQTKLKYLENPAHESTTSALSNTFQVTNSCQSLHSLPPNTNAHFLPKSISSQSSFTPVSLNSPSTVPQTIENPHQFHQQIKLNDYNSFSPIHNHVDMQYQMNNDLRGVHCNISRESQSNFPIVNNKGKSCYPMENANLSIDHYHDLNSTSTEHQYPVSSVSTNNPFPITSEASLMQYTNSTYISNSVPPQPADCNPNHIASQNNHNQDHFVQMQRISTQQQQHPSNQPGT